MVADANGTAAGAAGAAPGGAGGTTTTPVETVASWRCIWAPAPLTSETEATATAAMKARITKISALVPQENAKAASKVPAMASTRSPDGAKRNPGQPRHS